MSRPTILLPCDVKPIGPGNYHCVGEKYIDAVAHGAGAWPLLVPAFGAGLDLESLSGHVDLRRLLAGVDGVFLPGSASNVHPARYGVDDPKPHAPDTQRDELTFALIEETLALNIPLFAVCRGMQELNVALGGTLHTALHAVPGYSDHREDLEASREAQYALAHRVDVRAGGMLETIVGMQGFAVNSLHGQGVRDLAPILEIEATAPDGVIEAVSVRGSPAFALGVQWHPEWRWREQPASVALFAAFGAAAAARARERAPTPISG
ncbi:MAG: gamma-glutamyl-gamma-aminobutyrate hydrolase family protein [Pseudomonadales bacterium]